LGNERRIVVKLFLPSYELSKGDLAHRFGRSLWALASAERALKSARLAYGSAFLLALLDAVWHLLGLSRPEGLENTGWPVQTVLALALSGSGLWFLRMQSHRIERGAHPVPSWPAAALACLGLFSHAVYAVAMAIGWFESYQLKSAFDLVPARKPV
jgi:hypothetical protein